MSISLKNRLEKYTGDKFCCDDEKFNKLRKQYSKFVYDSYNIEENDKDIRITYNYIIVGVSDNIEFKHNIIIYKKNFINNRKINNVVELQSPIIDNIVFNIGIAEAISYYKSTCTQIFEINCGYLDNEQIEWWKKLYFLGLGEFRYRNNINVSKDELISFKCNSNLPKYNVIELENLKGNLIPVGGGKDSCVTMSLLAEYKQINTPFLIDTNKVHYEAAIKTIEAAGYKREDIFEVKRELDKRLIDLNKDEYLNGHIPISSIIAFIGVLSAVLIGKKYIILSNEVSANEATVLNSDINHQYSKSFEFEKDFDEYVGKYISKDVKYFSLLRPWTELQIVRELVRHKEFLNTFKSCNVGSQQNVWCGKCAKCLFTYIMLSPFLTDEELVNIFNKNILEDFEMKELFDKLVAEDKNKVFDCIGTKDEINLALSMTIEKLKKGNKKMPALLDYYIKNYSYDYIDKEAIEEYNSQSLIPEEYKKIFNKKDEYNYGANK